MGVWITDLGKWCRRVGRP